jgi:hypothetical protein
MLGGEEKDVPVATRLVPDARGSHYWDGSGTTTRTYQQVLGLPELAWDIYMVYGPLARWEGELPPIPELWMHQLGSREHPRVQGPFLDPDVFAARVNTLLGGTSRAP